jgi:hypothetical protein
VNPDLIENSVGFLDLLDIPRERKNKDLEKNRHGALLLDFCKGNTMLILNGRLNVTRLETSVVDNLISVHCPNFFDLFNILLNVFGCVLARIIKQSIAM